MRANLKDRDRLLNSLRAYLMLNLEDRRDKPFLQEWLAADWSLRYAGNTVGQRDLNQHFEHLLSGSFAPYALNQSLVAQARAVLRSESLSTVVYRMLREQASRLAEPPLFTRAAHCLFHPCTSCERLRQETPFLRLETICQPHRS